MENNICEIVNSYGIIGYSPYINKNISNLYQYFDQNTIGKFLLVRRKHSYAFTSFIRGDYSRKNLPKMFGEMTKTEKNRILNEDFKDLWESVTHKYFREKDQIKKKYERCLNRFNKIKCEYNNFELVIKNSISNKITPEWGFPKGQKRKDPDVFNFPNNETLTYNDTGLSDESDFDCAVREFEEETGINKSNLLILKNKPVYEYYLGTDMKMYRYLYYVGIVKNTNFILPVNQNNYSQSFEISNIGWYTKNEIIDLLGPMTNFRRKMIMNMNNIIKRFEYDMMDKNVNSIILDQLESMSKKMLNI